MICCPKPGAAGSAPSVAVIRVGPVPALNPPAQFIVAELAVQPDEISVPVPSTTGIELGGKTEPTVCTADPVPANTGLTLLHVSCETQMNRPDAEPVRKNDSP